MRFAALVLSVCLNMTAGGCVALAASAKADPARAAAPLDALLSLARAASGAPYRYHIVSVAHETHDGRTIEVTTETDGPKYRVRRCGNGLCSGFYFDGERGYDANLNNTALPLSSHVDALQLSLRAILSYAFTAPGFRASGGQLSEREPVLREGHTYRRLSVAPFRGALLDAIVDPRSGLVAAIVSDERNYAFELRDQRKVAGKLLLPYEIALNGSVLERFDRRSIANAPLEAPGGLVPDLASDARSIVMAKLERTTDQPVVPCSVGGASTTCLLDTGNSGLSMSLELAEKLGIEPRGGAFAIKGVGKYVTGIVRAPKLAVGAATYPSADYVVLHDLHQYGYDVVLGADAFAHARITIDYTKRTVAFAPTAAGRDASNATAVAIAFQNFIPVAIVRLGEQSATLAIDTGDESTINLDYDYYAAHPGIFKPNGSAPVSGIGGTSDEVTGEVPHIRLGDYEVARPKIGATKGLAATGQGHLGSGLLRHFTVTFDYGRSRIELSPRPGDSSVHAVP